MYLVHPTPPPLTLATLSLATIFFCSAQVRSVFRQQCSTTLLSLCVSTTMLFVKLGSAMTYELLFMRGVACDFTEDIHEIKSRRRRRVKCPAYHNVLAVVRGVIRDFEKKRRDTPSIHHSRTSVTFLWMHRF